MQSRHSAPKTAPEDGGTLGAVFGGTQSRHSAPKTASSAHFGPMAAAALGGQPEGADGGRRAATPYEILLLRVHCCDGDTLSGFGQCLHCCDDILSDFC